MRGSQTTERARGDGETNVGDTKGEVKTAEQAAPIGGGKNSSQKTEDEPSRTNGEGAPKNGEGAPKRVENGEGAPKQVENGEGAPKQVEGAGDGPLRGERETPAEYPSRSWQTLSAPAVATAAAWAVRRGLRRRGGGGKGREMGGGTNNRGVGGASSGVRSTTTVG